MISTARAAMTVALANARLGERPDRLLRAAWAMLPYGASALGAVAAASARTPRRIAVVDETGSISYAALWERAHALAGTLSGRGYGAGSRLGLMCGNRIDFVAALLATNLIGASTVLLNTRLAKAQITAIVLAEQLNAILVADELAAAAPRNRTPVITFAELSAATSEHTGRRHPPTRAGRIVLLTSGTTGTPKGAGRPPGGEVEATAALVSRVPLRHGDTRIIAAPVFHGWGLTHLLLGLGMSATIVLHDRFDPEVLLRSIAEHRAQAVVLVPVMLQRILELPPATLAGADTSSVRAIVCSGSALPARVAAEALRRFGPVLYNVYGSTEVALAAIATPSDLVEDPATAGRPVPGAVVRVLDEHDRPVPPGTTGRIFVRSALQFDGYTNGDEKPVVGSLMSSGDMGRFDRKGRLTVSGREDDMIVSGGENVYPRGVEETLAHHPDVADVVVVGIPDKRFGQSLRACLVLRKGSSLDAEGVKEYVRQRHAGYEVPRDVVFLDELPRNATGKVLRRELTR